MFYPKSIIRNKGYPVSNDRLGLKDYLIIFLLVHFYWTLMFLFYKLYSSHLSFPYYVCKNNARSYLKLPERK